MSKKIKRISCIFIIFWGWEIKQYNFGPAKAKLIRETSLGIPCLKNVRVFLVFLSFFDAGKSGLGDKAIQFWACQGQTYERNKSCDTMSKKCTRIFLFLSFFGAGKSGLGDKAIQIWACQG